MAKYVGYKRPKNTKKAMKNLLRYLGYHKWLLLLVAVLVAISSGVSIAGTYLIRPVINDYAIPGDIPGLIRMMLAMGILYLCGVCATFAYNRLMVHTSQQVVMEIRRDLFAHIQKLPLAYFDAHTHGELMSRFTNDVDTVQEALNGTFSMLIQSFLILTGTLSMLFVLSARLTLIVLLFLVASGFFIWYNGKCSKKYFNAQQEALAAVNGFVEEMTAGQKVEKVFNHEKQDLEEFLMRNERLRKASTNALTWSGMLVPVNVSMSYFNYGVSAAAGGIFALTGHMDLGTLASYLVYVRQSAMPLNQFTNQFNFLLAALSGAERIFDLMEQEPEIDEGTVTLCPVEVRMDGSLKETENYTGSFAWKDADSLTLLQGDVRFDQVVFGYTEEHKILDGISLFAKPGQKIAFVGSTGAGKTTIVNLINRFYDIQSGTITYDGIDIKDISKDDLRRSMAMVIQETHLFTGTIADNIRYGKLDATDEEVREAAVIANADSFIRRLPDGYDTMLYSDGSNLSQGQRQLLAIARAAVAKPPVLILDEATSSVDTRTEVLIQKGMERLMEGRTSFVIAHRLSTIRDADTIIVMKDGDIVELGNHDSLLEKDGFYASLYRSQFEGLDN